jgi:hypothetical protein
MTRRDECDLARFANSLGMHLTKLRDGGFWAPAARVCQLAHPCGGRLLLGSASGRHQNGVSLAEVQHFLERVRRSGR